MPQPKRPVARLLRIGTTRPDGGRLFGSTAKTTWETFAQPDRTNRVAIGNYCMLIESSEGWALVNVGPGDKPPLDFNIAPTRSRSSLLRELRELDLTPKDISVVIYTHMHDEYTGGGTHITSSGRTIPTFPNARYVVHRDALKAALAPNERARKLYRRDNAEPLVDYDVLDVVDGSTEVCPGVWVEPAAGPAPGHQIVICQGRRATFTFLGALVPTAMHLWPEVNSATDWNPEATARTKVEVRRQAVAERWVVGPVGADGWVPASELDDLAAFSLGQAKAPAEAQRKAAARAKQSTAPQKVAPQKAARRERRAAREELVAVPA